MLEAFKIGINGCGAIQQYMLFFNRFAFAKGCAEVLVGFGALVVPVSSEEFFCMPVCQYVFHWVADGKQILITQKIIAGVQVLCIALHPVVHGVLYALYGELNNKFLLEKILCIQRVQRKSAALMYELEMVFEKSRESNKVAKQSLSFLAIYICFFLISTSSALILEDGVFSIGF